MNTILSLKLPRHLVFAMSLIGAIMNTTLASEKAVRGILNFTMKTTDGTNIPLSKYKGKVLLVVNVASECGYTPQYKGLEMVFRKYKERGFAILGFPANNFGEQEPGSDPEIKSFCQSNYGVTFDMFSKISVKGADQHPLYRFITSTETNPRFGGEVRWNFQKYLVDRSGVIIGKFSSSVTPESHELIRAIEDALH